jgi:phospholipase D-like protein/putative oligomerization/nucleic acid binding protein
MVANTFWENFFLLLLFLPVAMLWALALIDIFHRDDIGGGTKVLWVVCVLVLPFLGSLIYLVTRPSGVTPQERVYRAEREAEIREVDGVSQLSTLADLHDRGKLTDSEFAAEKARLLGAESSIPA